MTNGQLYIDKSHISDGYFVARNIKPDNKRYKLTVIVGKNSLNYDIKDIDIVIPLQFGDGKYTVKLFKNVTGKKYASVGVISMTVKLSSATAPFIHPNVYVNYTPDSPCVARASKLCKVGMSNVSCVSAIMNYIKRTIIYDYIKALTVRTGTLPDIDGCYKNGRGICQDIAGLMVAMLRSQGIPASLVIGYADVAYHAWVRVYIEGTTKIYDPTAVLLGKKVKKYTVERWY